MFSLFSGRYLRVYRHLVHGRCVCDCASFVVMCGCFNMSGALSHFFQSGHALLSSSHNRTVSENVRERKVFYFCILSLHSVARRILMVTAHYLTTLTARVMLFLI